MLLAQPAQEWNARIVPEVLIQVTRWQDHIQEYEITGSESFYRVKRIPNSADSRDIVVILNERPDDRLNDLDVIINPGDFH